MPCGGCGKKKNVSSLAVNLEQKKRRQNVLGNFMKSGKNLAKDR